MTTTTYAGPLVDRDAALARVADLLADVRAGIGRSLVVEGPAGIGKTSVLAATAELAGAADFVVLRACGDPQERTFAFGVVRQLLERALLATEPGRREQLLAGAAAPAKTVLDLAREESDPPSAGDDRVAEVMRGLYWLTANIAADRPVLLLIDDLHWADTASQRWLAYLARRLQGLAVMLVGGARTGEPDPPPHIGTSSLTLEPLTPAGAGHVVQAVFAREVDPQLREACHAATGGNPFYLRELAHELARSGLGPGPEAAARVTEISPAAVRQSVIDRLERLPGGARALARAVAVLGVRAEMRHAATLARLDSANAARAAHALQSAGLLCPALLQFDHPIVRAVVYDEIPAFERALDHRRAAQQLAADGVDAIRVASHLMVSEPLGDPAVVDGLRTAASVALDRGAPTEAAAFLTRALMEPPEAASRAEVLSQLGGVELIARASEATGHLREAMDRTTDRVDRARVALQLAEVVGFAGQMTDARAITSQALRQLGDDDPALTSRLEAQRARTDTIDSRFAVEVAERFEELRGLGQAAGADGRELLLCLAMNAAIRGLAVDTVLELVAQGLDRGRYVEREGADAVGVITAVNALIYVDELPAVNELLAELGRAGRARGAVMAAMAEDGWGGYALHRCGQLAEAEVRSRSTLRTAQEHEQHFVEGYSRGFLADTLIAQGALVEAAELLRPPILAELRGTIGEMYIQLARGRLHVACGHLSEAAQVLRECGESCRRLLIRNPGLAPWRSLLAVAVSGTRHDEALELVDEELAIARGCGLARGIGTALHAAGLLNDGDQRTVLLNEAVQVLEGCPAHVERASALTDLGVSLRRSGRLVEARKPLNQALDLADSCGAWPLVERATAELRIAGARPRRRRQSGVQALTANENRVATMAAGGLSNPEIASVLFITRKTVEKHLSGAYRKLGVAGRAGLSQALNAGGDAAS